ncbi:MAG: DAK2 domain-containing protein, partial [Lachnospira sp.]|nr:DAK2 domain-containing protein [Lachnospira sp.]
MAVYTIDALTLKKMFLAGAKNLEAKKEWINDLNVFPVPDGDTGTNMTLTIMSAAKEVVAISNPTMESLAKAISSGSLRGARGNSGVILSQLFRGLTKEIKEVETIDAVVLANAFERAVETAYKAVMKPKEGTILTVAKGAAEKAVELSKTETDLELIGKAIIEHAEYVLSKTPDMLPVLKQAGVVDSGGQGLVEVLKGAYDALMGKEVDFDMTVSASKPSEKSGAAALDDVDIKFGYCTEFIIMLEKQFTNKDEVEFKAYLESIGDSIVCVADDEIVKIHVHTNDPGLAIQKALTYGQLTRMKIDNMREEHQERLVKEEEVKKAQEKEAKAAKADEPRKPVGFIAVCAGEGLAKIFSELGADYVIEGGQTMNPSTEDMLTAAEQVNADVIYILPNNSNI